VGSASEQGLRFVRNMILARLLVPEAFGLMAIVLSVCSLLQVLTGIGIKESIVQSPRGTERTYLNGAWWLAFGRGVALYLAALFFAPWIARFYETPELNQLLRVAFLGVLASGAMSAGAFVALKRMEYSKWVVIQQGGSLIGIATTLTLAFVLEGVWALVIGYATEGVARCLLSHLVCPFRPRWQFDWEDNRALFKFAAGMFGLPVLMMIYTEGTIFAVGKLCTKEQLGIFAMGFTLARIPSMFSNQVSELLMPAFSEMHKEPNRVNQGILKVTTLAVLFGLPAACFTAIFGTQILTVAYGARFASGSSALAFLFINELLLFCNVPLVSVYLAKGQPRLLRRFSAVRASVMIVLFWPFINAWGITGAAMVPLSAMVAAYGFQLARLRRLTDFPVQDYLAIWWRGLCAAIPLAIGWLMLQRLFVSLKPLPGLISILLVTSAIAAICAPVGFRRVWVRDYLWPFPRKA